MRVLVNALTASGGRTGIGHYTAELLRCLRDQSAGDTIDCFPSPWIRQTRRAWLRLRPWLERGGSPTPKAAAISNQSPGWRQQTLGRLRSLGHTLLSRNHLAYCRRGSYDLYHEPNFIPLPSDLPTIATLHDLSVLLHPEWHPADRVHDFERRFREGLSRCVHFLAISEFGRQEIIRTLNLRPDQVTRTYMGVRPGLGPMPQQQVQATLRRLRLPPRYLLSLGTIEPRKNVLTLLRAYCSLPDQLRSRYPLLLVGGWGWNSADVAAYLDAEAKARGVLHIGYVADEHMPALYNGARALLFPSFYEGFGLPPLEMMACGGAVIASTAGAIVETVGRRAHLVDPLDLDGWRTAMRRIVEDDDWQHELRRGVEEVARPFTWEACAADTLRAYHLVHGDTQAAVRKAG
jgi:glycosyltransferase involved in cell wall biosynthesis